MRFAETGRLGIHIYFSVEIAEWSGPEMISSHLLIKQSTTEKVCASILSILDVPAKTGSCRKRGAHFQCLQGLEFDTLECVRLTPSAAEYEVLALKMSLGLEEHYPT